MKYLIIAGVVAVVLSLVYRRVRPYIRLIQNLTQVTNTVLDQSRKAPAKGLQRNKLIRCVQCGTWIPEDRAITLGPDSNYCSRKCLEKMPAAQRKAVS